MSEADAVLALAHVLHQLRATSPTGTTPSWEALTPVLRCVPSLSDAASIIEAALTEIADQTLSRPAITDEQLDATRQELIRLAGAAWSPDADVSEGEALSIGPTAPDAQGFTILPSVRRYMTLEAIVHSARAAANGGVPPESLNGDDAALLARARRVVVNADFKLWVGTIHREASGNLATAGDRALLAQFVATLDESEQTVLGDALAASIPTFEAAGDDRLSAAWLTHLGAFDRIGGPARSRIATPTFIAAAKHIAMMAAVEPLEPELIGWLLGDDRFVALTANAITTLIGPAHDNPARNGSGPRHPLEVLASVWTHIHVSTAGVSTTGAVSADDVYRLADSVTNAAALLIGELVAEQLMAPHDGESPEFQTVVAALVGAPVAGYIGSRLASVVDYANATTVLTAVSHLFQVAGGLQPQWRSSALQGVAGLAGPVLDAVKHLLVTGEPHSNPEAQRLLEALTLQVNPATPPPPPSPTRGGLD